jgi:di/tricarboxylate transporter
MKTTLSPVIGALLLGLSYFISMFFFSSTTAHAVALSGPLLAASIKIGCPPHLIVAILSSFTALSACMVRFFNTDKFLDR